MTEEEKEATEFTKNLIETIKQSNMLFDEDITAKLGIATQNNLQIALNLIQKQQAEKEQLKAELKKKDKIINLMAFDIYGMQIVCNRYFKDIKEVKHYFEKKVEE